eukprot:1077829-Alexandrium_andersonii.AAC.1
MAASILRRSGPMVRRGSRPWPASTASSLTTKRPRSGSARPPRSRAGLRPLLWSLARSVASASSAPSTCWSGAL